MNLWHIYHEITVFMGGQGKLYQKELQEVSVLIEAENRTFTVSLIEWDGNTLILHAGVDTRYL